jgi:hypothetical protein
LKKDGGQAGRLALLIALSDFLFARRSNYEPFNGDIDI